MRRCSPSAPDFANAPAKRFCAHRGFSTAAPENSPPAIGAAVVLGAGEIEFDLWWTTDDEIVSIHDATFDRVSDSSGKAFDHTYEELLKFNFGSKKDKHFARPRILHFEDILKKFSCHTSMNIHMKDCGKTCDEEFANNGATPIPFPAPQITEPPRFLSPRRETPRLRCSF